MSILSYHTLIHAFENCYFKRQANILICNIRLLLPPSSMFSFYVIVEKFRNYIHFPNLLVVMILNAKLFLQINLTQMRFQRRKEGAGYLPLPVLPTNKLWQMQIFWWSFPLFQYWVVSLRGMRKLWWCYQEKSQK